MTEKTSWGGVADWYDKLLGSEDTFQSKVILPHLMRTLEVQPGERVLDLACGQGYFSYALASTGAEVTGADVSPELIALAQKNAPKAPKGDTGKASAVGKPDFFAASADKLTALQDARFDRVLIVLAIQNIENVKGTFAECSRVLKPGGTLHLVLNHPSFRIPKGSSWAWDKNGSQYRRIDKYLSESKEKIQMKPGSDESVVTVSFHRPLQFYVKALVRAGFAVSNLEEWISHRNSDSGPRAEEENRARNEIPMFMYLEARKAA